MTKPHELTAGWQGLKGRAALGAAGLAVVVAGLLLPQLLPGGAPPPPQAAVEKPTQDGPLAYQPPAWPDGPGPRALLGRLVLGTAVVLGLCVIVLRSARRWLGPAQGPRPGGGSFDLVDTFALGNRCYLHLVKVGKQQVLVGLDPSGMKAVVPLPESFDSALAELQKGEAERADGQQPIADLDSRGVA